jgi:hypothetical protein
MPSDASSPSIFALPVTDVKSLFPLARAAAWDFSHLQGFVPTNVGPIEVSDEI